MDDTYIIAVYIFCDDVLIGLGHEDDSQSKMTNAEVLTFAIIASKFFNSNHKLARAICLRDGLFDRILSPSRINRRLHKIPLEIWYLVANLSAFNSPPGRRLPCQAGHQKHLNQQKPSG